MQRKESLLHSPTRPPEFDYWINQVSPGVPEEFRDSLYQTVNGIANFIYRLRGGGKSTPEQKELDFSTAQEIAYQSYLAPKKESPLKVLKERLDGKVPDNLTEEDFYSAIFGYSGNGKT